MVKYKFHICLIVAFIVTITVFSQNTGLQDGYHIFNYPNGSVSSEGYIRNGKPDGYWKSYYVTGVLKSEGKRRNFTLDSVWVFYSQTGNILEKIDYLLGKKSGYYLKYKVDKIKGQYIWYRELFAADKREGTAYIYFPDGSVKQTIPYLNSKKQGLSKEFDNDGNIITLYEYNNDFLISRERINRKDNEDLKQGEWKSFWENGNIHYEMTYRNDLLHGYYKEYNINGILVVAMLYDGGEIVEENIDDDPEIELVNRYDNRGNLIYSGPFRQNRPVGIHREYNEDGIITNSFIYNDEGIKMSEGIVNEEGRRNGTWKNYYNNGKIKETGSYLDNRRSGIWNFYNNSSNIVQTGGFRNGRADGLWQWYYDDGSTLMKEEYYLGKRDGNFVEYSKSGEIIGQGQYVDNEKNGNWIYTVGDHREEGNYIIGLRDGIWKYFDDEMNIMFKGDFIQDNPNGYHIYYFSGGKVKEEQYYKMGIKQRSWKKYDTEGVLIMTISYRDNVERRINGVKINLPESNVRLIK